MAYYINIETLPSNSFMKIIELDKTLVGTEDYMGFAYFWAYEYRHYMRSQRPHTLRKIHSTFLANKMELNGVSERHFDIIKRTVNHKLNQ
jgi:hypothetical protein